MNMGQIMAIFSNDQLSVFENIVLWLNLIGAVIAVYYNYKASATGIPRLRLIHFLVAAFALVYALGYAFLIFCDPSYLLWSTWFRGISLFVWFIVWTAPARSSYKLWRDVQRQVELYEREEEADDKE